MKFALRGQLAAALPALALCGGLIFLPSMGSAQTQTPGDSLVDVSPEDWAFDALQRVVEDLNCPAEFGRNEFARSFSRYEAAAILVRCEEAFVEARANGSPTSAETLQSLQRLTELFEGERNILTSSPPPDYADIASSPATAQTQTPGYLFPIEVGPDNWEFTALQEVVEALDCPGPLGVDEFSDSISLNDAVAILVRCEERYVQLERDGFKISAETVRSLKLLTDQWERERSRLTSAPPPDYSPILLEKPPVWVVVEGGLGTSATPIDIPGARGQTRREDPFTIVQSPAFPELQPERIRTRSAELGLQILLPPDPDLPWPANENGLWIDVAGDVQFGTGDFFDPARPSNGETLVLLSPVGPGGPAGGGVTITDGGIGFADVLNFSSTTDYRNVRVEVGGGTWVQVWESATPLPPFEGFQPVSSFDAPFPGPPDSGFIFRAGIQVAVGAEFMDTETESRGQSGVIGGTPTLDFERSTKLQQTQYDLIFGPILELETATGMPGVSIGTRVEAMGGISFLTQSATSSLITNGAADVNEVLSIEDSRVAPYASFSFEVFTRIDRTFEISLQLTADRQVFPTLEHSFTQPALLEADSGWQASAFVRAIWGL